MSLNLLILIALTGLPLTGVGQNMRLINYQASNGVEYKVGSPVHLGTGTNEDQSFNYARRSSPKSYIDNELAASFFVGALPAFWCDQTLKVQSIRQVGTKKEGYRIYLICSESGIRNYWIDIEAAISSREVLRRKSP